MSTAWTWIKWVAKAITAVVAVVLAGVTGGELDLDPNVVIALQALLAFLGVFAVRNGESPSS